MFKKLLGLTLSLVLVSLSAGVAMAATPSVHIVQLPEFMRSDNFSISYSALDMATVELAYHKEGSGWTVLGTFTTNSGQFTMTPTQINSETKYYFKATACDGGSNCTTSETSTTIDRSAPPTPEGYSKERVGSQSYRLRWHNTDSDDIYQVYIYRSDTRNFTADNNTLVAQLSVSKNTDTIWDNAVPVADREYFYILRGVDRAGNATSPFGDTIVITETSTSVPSGQPVVGNEAVPGQTLVLSGDVTGSVLGEETSTPTEEKVAEAVAEEKSEEVKPVEQIQSAVDEVTKSSLFWPLAGLAGLGFVVYWFLLRKN